MSTMIRFASGFVIGAVLAFLAFMLADIDHGTYAAVAANTSIFLLFFLESALIPLLIPPLCAWS
jgi:hypothetical protein